MKFVEKSISSRTKVVSMNRPQVIVPGVEPPRKPPVMVRPNTTQRLAMEKSNKKG